MTFPNREVTVVGLWDRKWRRQDDDSVSLWFCVVTDSTFGLFVLLDQDGQVHGCSTPHRTELHAYNSRPEDRFLIGVS